MTEVEFTAETVIRAYCVGAFPMARGHDGPIEWFSPNPRAIQPIDEATFHVPKNLAKRVRSGRYRVTRNAAFDRVIRSCAKPRKHAGDTWINPQIVTVYCQLHRMGCAHSVEAWDPQGAIAGGLYGVALGGAFFGESMFSQETDASKVCLVHLVEHLRDRGFTLLDVQFHNQHLEQFGIVEISREQYLRRLEDALKLTVGFE